MPDRLGTLVAAFVVGAASANSAYVNNLRPRATIDSVPQAAWDSLNSSVNGNLGVGVPLGYSCYTSYNGQSKDADSAQCSSAESGAFNTFALESSFGGYDNANWGQCQATGAGCGLSRSDQGGAPIERPCSSGSIPGYYINVSSVGDVQAGLSFAKNYSVRLVVKNSGHDYQGRSSGPDSLALWTRNYLPAITKTASFRPAGCKSPIGTVVTFGAGQGFKGLYEFANANNVTIVGGNSPTVGASGGWLTGGGHSILANTYGLGVDNVQQIKAVLPNGTYFTASRCQNTDMFFALRGGGGNAFGIIMETTTLAHPVKPLQVASISFPAMDQATLLAFMQVIVANANKWASQGFGGYVLPRADGTKRSTMTLLTPSLSLANTKTALKPLTNFLNSHYTTTQQKVSIGTKASFYAYYSQGLELYGGGSTAASSRLLPANYYNGTANQNKTAQALTNILLSSQNATSLQYQPLVICLTSPSTYKLPASDQPGGAGASAVTPAWRTSPWQIAFQRSWDVNDATAGGAGSVAAAFQAAHDVMQPLRQMSPDGGAYQNEADTFEPDPIASFWGVSNYNRLLSIKKKIDPTNLLTCHNCVGWDSTDARYGCYPPAPT